VQVHEYSFVIDAPREDIWAAMHPKIDRRPPGTEDPRIIEHGDVRIEILNEGDENGDGLVRHCWFPVPKYLFSGGRAQSWEMVSQVRVPEFSRYDAIGKPLWSRAMGWYRLDDLGDGRTNVTFHEEYHVFNPVLRALLEKRVHRFISRDNDVSIKNAIEHGLKALTAGHRGASHE
jgi:hypothetical protein